jgi:hypothetical protein
MNDQRRKRRCRLGLRSGPLGEGQVKNFSARVLRGAPSTPCTRGRNGDPQHRAARTGDSDRALGPLPCDLALALPNQGPDFLRELAECRMRACGSFKVDAQRVDDFVELLLQAAIPARVPPPEVVVPVDLPGLQDGDYASAGHETEGLEAERQGRGARYRHDLAVAASPWDEPGGELGVQPVGARELSQKVVGTVLAEPAAGAPEFVVTQLSATWAGRPFVVELCGRGGVVVHGRLLVRCGKQVTQ